MKRPRRSDSTLQEFWGAVIAPPPTIKQNGPDAEFRCACAPKTGPADKTRIIR
jgi:hypothetical protein